MDGCGVDTTQCAFGTIDGASSAQRPSRAVPVAIVIFGITLAPVKYGREV